MYLSTSGTRVTTGTGHEDPVHLAVAGRHGERRPLAGAELLLGNVLPRAVHADLQDGHVTRVRVPLGDHDEDAASALVPLKTSS